MNLKKCPLCKKYLLREGEYRFHCSCDKNYYNFTYSEYSGCYYFILIKNAHNEKRVSSNDIYLSTLDLKKYKLITPDSEDFIKLKCKSPQEAINKSLKLILIS